METRQDARNLIVVLLITCAIVSVYGITQIGSVERVTAPFEGKHGEHGTFGGYLTLVLALVVSFFIYADRPRLKILFGLLALIIVVPLLNTLSRASYMAFFPTFIVLFLVSRRRGFLGWVLGLSLIILPFIAPALQPFIDRASYTFQEGGLDPSSQERVDRAVIIFLSRLA